MAVIGESVSPRWFLDVIDGRDAIATPLWFDTP